MVEIRVTLFYDVFAYCHRESCFNLKSMLKMIFLLFGISAPVIKFITSMYVKSKLNKLLPVCVEPYKAPLTQ